MFDSARNLVLDLVFVTYYKKIEGRFQNGME